jgi:hypothetical protein
VDDNATEARMAPQRCAAAPGEAGDCYRACLATILGVPASTVPNFNELARRTGLVGEPSYLAMQDMVRTYLRPLGLSVFGTYCNGEWPIEKALDYFSGHSPGVPVIFNGQSIHLPDESHAVIALDGRIVHDPSGAGIAGPVVCEGGSKWWFMDVIAVTDNGIRAALEAIRNRKGEG